MNKFIAEFIAAVGGRKMFTFLLLFLSITFLFIFGYDVSSYAMAMSPFVGLLVVGNLTEYKIKKGSSETKTKF